MERGLGALGYAKVDRVTFTPRVREEGRAARRFRARVLARPCVARVTERIGRDRGFVKPAGIQLVAKRGSFRCSRALQFSTMDVPLYVFAAAGYALIGVVLGLSFRFGTRLRENPWAHLGVAAISFGAALPALAVSTAGSEYFSEYHLGLRGLLFLAAGFCHLPVLIYIALFHWGRLIERLTSGTRLRGGREEGPLNPRQEWLRARGLLEALARDPLDYRRREALARSYLALGSLEAAIREYAKAVECVEGGYEHARLLYKTIYLLVEQKKDVERALPLLRRLLRLYPRSCFAAYARRVLNHHEAHEAAGRSRRESAGGDASGSTEPSE